MVILCDFNDNFKEFKTMHTNIIGNDSNNSLGIERCIYQRIKRTSISYDLVLFLFLGKYFYSISNEVVHKILVFKN